MKVAYAAKIWLEFLVICRMEINSIAVICEYTPRPIDI